MNRNLFGQLCLPIFDCSNDAEVWWEKWSVPMAGRNKGTNEYASIVAAASLLDSTSKRHDLNMPIGRRRRERGHMGTEQ